MSLYPYCDILKLSAPTTGSIIDYGYCISDNLVWNVQSDTYRFENFVLVPPLKAVMPKPTVEFQNNNVPQNSEFVAAYVPGYRGANRRLVKWPKADDNTEFTYIATHYTFGANEPIAFELGILPSDEPSTPDFVAFYFGDMKFKVTVHKNAPPELLVYDASILAYRKVADIALDLHNVWSDSDTRLIYVFPVAGGLLFSTNLNDFAFVRTWENNFNVPSGQAVFKGKGCVAIMGAHKVTFSNGSIKSDVFNAERELQGTPEKRLRGWIAPGASYSISITYQNNNKSFYYTLSFTPGTKCSAITHVNITFPPQYITYRETVSIVHNVVEAIEQISEDPISTTFEFVVDNPNLDLGNMFKRFQPIVWKFGYFTGNNSRVEAQRGIAVITGIEDSRAENEQPKLRLQCGSLLTKVKEAIVVQAPDYTGYVVKDALKDFLKRCGIPESMQDIYNWDWTLPEPGESGNWKPEPGTSAWSFLEELVYNVLGGWIYVTADGKIRIEPYPDIDELNFDNAIVFYPEDFKSITYEDTEEALHTFYNAIHVFGLSTDGKLLVASRINEESLYNPESEVFVDYYRPLILWSAAYCTQELCTSICNTLYNKFSKIRRRIKLVTHIDRGNIYATVGSKIKIVREGQGNTDAILIESLQSELRAGEFQQTITGVYKKI